MLLQDEGYEVDQRDLLLEDLAEVERLAPHVILVDLYMGARHAGWEFTQRLNASPSTQHIPIILCTAESLTPEQLQIAQQQRIPIVYKPFELYELLHLVQSLSSGSLSSP